MADPWTEQQVTALAPDASSLAAARPYAAPGRWTATGADAAQPVVWGTCTGSGQSLHRSVADPSGPAFSCSCPSRKLPCKHVLGLLLLWSGGHVPQMSDAPERVTAWQAARTERPVRGRPGAGSRAGPAPEAAHARAERRRARMLDGLAELEQWLRDQVRSGLAGTDRAGYAPFDALAARLVDAQIPAVAAVVRQLPAIVVGEGWPARLLEEYALLHLLATAAPGALTGPRADLAATVRARLGVTVPRDEVLATAGQRDRWRVLALRDDVEERLTARRVWLRGENCGRLALVLSFAAAGQPLDTSLVPDTVVDADLYRYPGTLGLRALVGTRGATVRAAAGVPGVGLDDALDARASALAADPWLRTWPVVLAGVVPVLDDAGWWLVDAGGSLPLIGRDEHRWTLLAASGGHPVTVLAEIEPTGIRPIRALPTAGRDAGDAPRTRRAVGAVP